MSKSGENGVPASSNKGEQDYFWIRLGSSGASFGAEGLQGAIFCGFLLLAAIFIVYPPSRGGVPRLKLDADADITTYIHRVNSTIGSLLKELEGVQGQLVALQRTNGKV